MAKISINQLAEFSSGTIAAKRRIVKQQIKVDKNLVPWYQFAKGCIRRYLADINSLEAIEVGIEKLNAKKPETSRQLLDKRVSLEALEKIRTLKLPKLLEGIEYELVKPPITSLVMAGVDIIISPDIIIKAHIRGKTVYGAVKIHISKGKPFDQIQAQYVSTLLHQYLKTIINPKNEFALPELCFCLDVFSDRIVSASNRPINIIKELKSFCLEVSKIWDTLN